MMGALTSSWEHENVCERVRKKRSLWQPSLADLGLRSECRRPWRMSLSVGAPVPNAAHQTS